MFGQLSKLLSIGIVLGSLQILHTLMLTVQIKQHAYFIVVNHQKQFSPGINRTEFRTDCQNLFIMDILY